MRNSEAPRTAYREEPVLYMSIELAERQWKLAFGIAPAVGVRVRTVVARDLGRVLEEISRARARLDLPENCRVTSCYEAGQDGFWIHRWLVSEGIENQMVDPSSLRVSRRGRRAKTDRIDVQRLLQQLMEDEYLGRKTYRVVRVPSVEQEGSRHLHRELEVLKQERTRHRNRARSLLKLYGAVVRGTGHFSTKVRRAVAWDGRALPGDVKDRVERELRRLQLVMEQIRELEKARRERVQESKKARRLFRLRSIGESTAWLLSEELFAWRQFSNRRQVGSCAGLTPTPYATGQSSWEQGISKAGNRRVRKQMVEIAWLWLRYQPRSDLTRWFQTRFGPGSKRNRRVGIVALARKLLVALWRYVEEGIVPAGATLKA